jgi:hypothetical protein
VQRLVQHLAAEQIHKDPQTPEEDRKTKVKVLKYRREHLAVFRKIDGEVSAFTLQNAGFEMEIPTAAAIEIIMSRRTGSFSSAERLAPPPSSSLSAAAVPL